MKKMVLFLSFAVVVGFIAYYLVDRPVYILNSVGGEVVSTDLLAKYKVRYAGLPMSDFVKNTSWFEKYLALDNNFTKVYRQRFKKFKNFEVEMEVNFENYGAVIISYDANSSKRCMVFPYVDDGVNKVLFQDFNGVTNFAGSLVERCNLGGSGVGEVEFASFKEFVYSDLLSCFGSCSLKNGVLFRSKMTKAEAASIPDLVFKQFRGQLLKHIEEDLGETILDKIEVDLFVADGEDLYVFVSFNDDFYGQIKSTYLVRFVEGQYSVVESSVYRDIFSLIQ